MERDCLAPGGSDCGQGWSLQRQERLEEAGEDGERVEDWEEEEKGVGRKRRRGIGWKEKGVEEKRRRGGRRGGGGGGRRGEEGGGGGGGRRS